MAIASGLPGEISLTTHSLHCFSFMLREKISLIWQCSCNCCKLFYLFNAVYYFVSSLVAQKYIYLMLSIILFAVWCKLIFLRDKYIYLMLSIFLFAVWSKNVFLHDKHIYLMLSIICLQFGAKICLLTSFRDTCSVEIIPRNQAPQRGNTISYRQTTWTSEEKFITLQITRFACYLENND